MLAVKNGLKQPWEIFPYATWKLNDMDASGCSSIRSAGYDAGSGRLYFAQGYAEEARIDVYQISGGTLPSPAPAPAPAPDTTAPEVFMLSPTDGSVVQLRTQVDTGAK